MRAASPSAVLRDILSLVMDRPPSVRRLVGLGAAARRRAMEWAVAEVLAANDNPVRRLPMPKCLRPAVRR